MSGKREVDATVLVTVDITGKSPDAALVAAAMGVPEAAIEPRFGVVLIDPRRRRYAVKVDAVAFERRVHKRDGVSGPYSDPVISALHA